VRAGAIVILGEHAGEHAQRKAIGILGNGTPGNGTQPGNEEAEWLDGAPIASLELLGQSALRRTVNYLRQAGADSVSFVAKPGLSDVIANTCGPVGSHVLIDHSDVPGFVLRRVAEECLRNGTNTLVLIRLGAYVEYDLDDLLQFHRAKSKSVTRVYDNDGPLDFWVVDAARFSRGELDIFAHSDAVARYDRTSYVNRLVHAADVRHLIVDAFSLRHSIRPLGTEISPGVWLDTNAWLHPKARVAGPVYIGREVRVQSTAFVARYSSVESSCNVGCGTVVAEASILAHTYLGAWLDVSHSVVYGSRVANLRHNVVVDIKDDRLIRRIIAAPPFRRFFPGPREFQRPDRQSEPSTPAWQADDKKHER